MLAFDLQRRLVAEALGTAVLVATVVGSGIMAETLTKDVALALLGNTLPTGAILVVLITILGPVSGAHFNPAVSLVFWLRRELTPRDAVFYVVAQIKYRVARRRGILCGGANRRWYRGDIAGACDVCIAADGCVAEGSHRRRAMAGRGGGRVWPGRDHSGRHPLQPPGNPLAGWPLHHGGVLV